MQLKNYVFAVIVFSTMVLSGKSALAGKYLECEARSVVDGKVDLYAGVSTLRVYINPWGKLAMVIQSANLDGGYSVIGLFAKGSHDSTGSNAEYSLYHAASPYTDTDWVEAGTLKIAQGSGSVSAFYSNGTQDSQGNYLKSPFDWALSNCTAD